MVSGHKRDEPVAAGAERGQQKKEVNKLLPKFTEQDYAMWVGRKFYPTQENYIEEARRLGCCKKVPHIPDGVEIGKSRIFLVHKEDKEKPVVFGYFLLDGIIACSKLQEVIEEVKESLTGEKTYPVTAIGTEARRVIPQRGCGGIDPPSYYFVGPWDITVQLGFRKPYTERATAINLIEPLVSCKFLSCFRGLKKASELWLEE